VVLNFSPAPVEARVRLTRRSRGLSEAGRPFGLLNGDAEGVESVGRDEVRVAMKPFDARVLAAASAAAYGRG
jgi:hypothetical protein